MKMTLKNQKPAEQENKHAILIDLFKRKKRSVPPLKNCKCVTEENYDSQFKDFYAVTPPFGNVGVQLDRASGRLLYRVIEPTMDAYECATLEKLKNMLQEETHISLAVLRQESSLEAYLTESIQKMVKRFKLDVSKKSIEKFSYYIKRDFLGYGPVDVLIKDPNIEDVSCNGTAIPIYVWHRLYESLPTNVSFASKIDLDTFITRLSYRSGHQISISNPILEGALPEGFRIHVTLDEVSEKRRYLYNTESSS
jgi:archaeal flagellar protein FlaI